HHVQAGAYRQRILRNFIACDVGQLGNRKRAKLHAVPGRARLNCVGVVDTCSAGGEQLQVPIHAVLVERNEQVDAVTHVGDLFGAGTNGKKSVAPANDGLIGVVGVEVEAAPAEDLCENVAWSGNALSSRATDADRKGLLHHALTD